MSHQVKSFLDGLGRFGWRLGLDNIGTLCSQLGNPQELFPAVHIAGTNGKGSTAALVERILRAAGYRTGLYTSPHLVDVTERIGVGGEPISWQELAKLIQSMRATVESLPATYFETLTAAAFRHFADSGVDIAVVEVGLGGRLDATNVVHPELTVVTPVGLDHCQHLGASLEQIAAEKAGILKPGVPCVVAAMPPAALEVIRRRATELGCQLACAEEIVQLDPSEFHPSYTLANLRRRTDCGEMVKIGLPGRFQLQNVSTGVAIVEVLRQRGWKISEAAVQEGLERVWWPGRLQRVQHSPDVVLDAAHNPEALRHVLDSLREIYRPRKMDFVLGVLSDRPIREILQTLATAAGRIWCVPVPSERSAPPEEICRAARQQGLHADLVPSPVEALDRALQQAAAEDLICVTGSHYTIGPVIRELTQKT